MLYKEWLNDWLENYVSPSAKPRTYARYSDVVQKRLIPKFGDIEMAELTPYIMQKYITELTQRGNVMTGKGLSTNTVNSISLFSAIRKLDGNSFELTEEEIESNLQKIYRMAVKKQKREEKNK